MPFPQTVASPVPDGAMYTTRSFGHLNFIAIHPTCVIRGHLSQLTARSAEN